MDRGSPLPPRHDARRQVAAPAPALTSRARAALERREQLLDTAETLFLEHGYAGTSTKRIAETAGVAEGLVFHYFGTKDALLLEVFSRRASIAGRIAELVLDPAPRSAHGLLRAIADVYASAEHDDVAFAAFAMAEARVHPQLASAVAGATDQMLAHVVKRLRAAVESGEIDPTVSLEAAARGFFGGFTGYFLDEPHAPARTFRARANTFASGWLDVVWRGLARRPDASRGVR